MSITVYYNGAFVDVDSPQVLVDERGHQFGDGVYEVVRVYGGRPFLLESHLERFERSLDAVEISNPMTRSEWVELIGEAIRRSGEAEAIVYWQVTRGAAARSHLFPQCAPAVSLTVRPFSAKAPDPSPTLVCLPDERWSNAYVKTINLLPNVMAKEIAHRSGAVEALLVRDGVITEGSSSNAWFVRGGDLWTAPANRFILGGITRKFVLQLANKLGITVHEESIRFDEFTDVEEIFMTGTTVEILPVKRVVVDPSIRAELLSLPSQPPSTLLRALDNLSTVWESSEHTPITSQLSQAYAEHVEKFSRFEEFVV